MDKPLETVQLVGRQEEPGDGMDVFTQEDAVENFLAGENKDDDFNEDLLLSHVDNENEEEEDIEFKRENILECGDLEGDVLEGCELNGTAENNRHKEEKSGSGSGGSGNNNNNNNVQHQPSVDFKRLRRNSLVNALKKRSIRCLNKMHVMEDIREGSDVPGAQPSSPGHAEQRPNLEKSNNNNNKDGKEEDVEEQEQEAEKAPPTVAECVKIKVETELNIKEEEEEEEKDTSNKEPEDKDEETKTEGEMAVESGTTVVTDKETEPVTEDAGSNDSTEALEESQYSKRKLDGDESPSTKRLKSELEQDYVIRDKILNEYVDASGCSTLQQIQMQMDQILSEIRTLNEMAKEKEKEWNNLIHLKKIKEELLLRIQRRKQIMILTAVDQQDDETSLETQSSEDQLLRRNKQMKNSIDGGGLMIFSTSPRTSGGGDSEKTSKQQRKQFLSTTIEINGQSGDPKQNRQRPTLDVQTIIADYRQRHPEVVPRRGRRIRSLLNSQGGTQTKHGSIIDSNSELSLLLTAVDNAKHSGSGKLSLDSQSHIETTSFKDVLMQFAKLSKHERQDLLQNAMKPPPYSEVTVHPVPAVHTQSSSSNSLLHGILTKTQTSRTSDNSKSTFSPTLARLLTAPERAAAGSPHPNNHTTVTPVSITDMLSNNKARNEITITPVGGQFDLSIKDKSNNTEEEEAEDSADRLVIDESEMLDSRGRITDNGSDDTGDEVPQCQGCNQKPAQFVCAGCGNQWYCSRECQVVAWDEHSEVCSG